MVEVDTIVLSSLDVDSDYPCQAMNSNADTNHRKEKRCKAHGTKKCGCSFLLKGVNIGRGDEWKLEIVMWDT